MINVMLSARCAFDNEIENKNKEEFMEVITLILTRGATFPVTTVGVDCNALTSTSATKSCISETFYNQLVLSWLLKAFHLVVTSTSFSILCPMGIVQCPIQLGWQYFEFNFIVCWNLTTPDILGLDFMHRHQIGLTWCDFGKGLPILKKQSVSRNFGYL